MSRAAEATFSFAGEDRQFRLPIGRLRALQEKTDCGPMELLSRFAAGTWRVDDLRETIYQGLLGGGMEVKDAAGLMKTDFDDLPLQQFVPLCQAIVMVAVIGAPDEDTGEPKGEAETSSPSPEASSGSAISTDPEQSSV